MIRDLAEEYLKGHVTPGEAEKVLEWFETKEGREFLNEKLFEDWSLAEKHRLSGGMPELRSDRLYNTIHQKIKKRRRRGVFKLKKADWPGILVKIAAAILVVATASYLAVQYDHYSAGLVTEREPVIFITGDEENREIKLGDGTVIRLNNNSQLVVSKDFLHGTREITLDGEAYFEVEHDPGEPFIIHANRSVVEVLGTAFNVRSLSDQANVQVAVTEGKVQFRNHSPDYKDEGVILTKGQYGYLDIHKRKIHVDETAVDNYLAWKNGRMIFEGLALQQVCTQLKRLYEVECGFEAESISNQLLTANFANESLEKTLSVIALTLNIEVEINGDRLFWALAD